MFSCSQKVLCIFAAWLLAVDPVVYGQAAPVPPQIGQARAVFVSNGGGK